MNLTRSRIAHEIYSKYDWLTQKEAHNAVHAFFRVAKDCLISGEDLLLSKFGKFKVRDKKERLGRNPQTNATLMISARRVVTFSATGRLRKILNEKDDNRTYS